MTLSNKSSSHQDVKTPFFKIIGAFLTEPSDALTTIEHKRKAQLLAGFTLVISILVIIGAFFGQASSAIYLFAFSGIGFLCYLISRTKFYAWGAFLFVTSFTLSPYIANIGASEPNIKGQIYAWIPLALIVASALLNKWALLLFTGVSAASIFGLLTIYPDRASEIFAPSGIISVIGFLLVYIQWFRENIEKTSIDNLKLANRELSDASLFLEERVEERTQQLNRKTEQLEAAAMVARAAAETSNIKSLLENVTSQISSRFGFYHAGIFLSDTDRQKVYLAAASSEGGKRMLARGHSLDIGREGVVGYAAYEKRPRIVQDTDSEHVHFRNPDLPETHSEVALPLMVKNQVIGVLDIQSTERSPFSTEDLFILQTMADQVALAIQNARLLEESNSALQQLQSLSTKSIQDAWKSHLGTQTKGYVYSSGNIYAIAENNKNDFKDNEKKIDIEIELRGQQIGTISLKRDTTDSGWTEKEQEFTEKIAGQIALAIENARLLEDSQRRAAREQTLNELTTRLSRSLDVETLLQNAVRELHKLPQVTDASVVIAPQEPRKQE